ncbi:methyl-accepting chemotaxis protein [Oceanobacillus alkalisoli]|uniref:methyl-accepting chemotaxis protein n=1 Tax=Oceanobacillus alkalisoli TaxID=2925113 RepID=UPI001F11C069|nr:methyl-accepting chemotaxis protein [Oceanobacillus alkalisoli]MCF3942851.1 methyl-accepting chemotaxis protein [Oceanobacillus alkalisoli]
MLRKFAWQNIKIGGKYTVVFAFMALAFVVSIFITFLFLQTTDHRMEDTTIKNELSSYAGELVTIYQEKYLFIPEYILLSDDEMLSQYMDKSIEFVDVAKNIKPLLNKEQLASFDQMIANNHELDQYFFSMIVPNVQQINTDEFAELQQVASTLKNETAELGQQLMDTATEESEKSLHTAQNDLKQVTFILILSASISIVISIILLFFISRNISEGLRNIVQHSGEIASGNLNIEPLKVKGQDEIAQLSNAMNHMGSSLRDMISEIQELSREVDQQSTALLESSVEVKVGSEQVAATIEEMAKGSTSQADNSVEISESTQQFSLEVIRAGEQSNELNTFSNEVLEASTNGDKLMKETVQQMAVIHDVMKESLERITSLEHKTRSITELVDVIQSIADQTNLLALNASIEAARAGEAGRGFTVVATEVRNLSEGVAQSVTKISDIVFSIIEETAQISEELNLGYTEVDKGAEQIQLTGKSFSAINANVEEMTDKIRTMSTIFQTIEDSSSTINESVEQIAAISEESAAGSEEISASVHEQAASVDNISSSAQDLASMVERMNRLIQRFKL